MGSTINIVWRGLIWSFKKIENRQIDNEWNTRVYASKITKFFGKDLDLHFTGRHVLIRVWLYGSCYLIYNGQRVGDDVAPLQFPTLTEDTGHTSQNTNIKTLKGPPKLLPPFKDDHLAHVREQKNLSLSVF